MRKLGWFLAGWPVVLLLVCAFYSDPKLAFGFCLIILAIYSIIMGIHKITGVPLPWTLMRDIRKTREFLNEKATSVRRHGSGPL